MKYGSVIYFNKLLHFIFYSDRKKVNRYHKYVISVVNAKKRLGMFNLRGFLSVTLAAVTANACGSPCVSTAICRLIPDIFFPAS